MTLANAKGKRAALLIAMLCFASVSGCMTTPVPSMLKLSKLSPLTAVPSDMRFAVRSPNFLRIRSGDITITMAFRPDNDAAELIGVYKPEIDENAIAGQGITIGHQDGSRLAIAKLSPQDATSMTALQAEIKALKAKGVKGVGRFFISATGCAEYQAPDGPILLTTWLRTTPSEDYFILARNVDMRPLFSKNKSAASQLPPCG